MKELILNFDLLKKLGLYVFVPMLLIIIGSRLILFICTRKIKKQNIVKYNNIINYWTNLVAIFIAIVLLGISMVYVVYFINTMKIKNLIEENKLLYSLVIIIPIIPFSFFFYYLLNLIYLIRENKEQDKKEQELSDFQVPNIENFNKLMTDINNDRVNFVDSNLKEKDSNVEVI